MSKVLTVEEALKEIAYEGNSARKLSKKRFEELAGAMMNDLTFEFTEAKISDDKVKSVEKYVPSTSFRTIIKDALIKFGVDKSEAEKVMEPEFVIGKADMVYDFVAALVYEFMKSGNRFDLKDQEDFRGSFELVYDDEIIEVADAYAPPKEKGGDREFLGRFETTKKPRYKCKANAACPAWLKTRVPVGK